MLYFVMDLDVPTLEEDLAQLSSMNEVELRDVIVTRGEAVRKKISEAVVRTEAEDDRKTRDGWEAFALVSRLEEYKDLEMLRNAAGRIVVLDHARSLG